LPHPRQIRFSKLKSFLLKFLFSFCLHISTSSNRTLVLENDGSKWYYSAKWADVFEQLTNCEYEKHVNWTKFLNNIIVYVIQKTEPILENSNRWKGT